MARRFDEASASSPYLGGEHLRDLGSPSSRIDLAWRIVEGAGAIGDRSLGQFATPRPIALAMADALLRRRQADSAPHSAPISDPACGTGALLLAVAERALALGLPVPPLVGRDIDDEALTTAEAALWVALGDCDGASGDLALRDALAEGIGGPRDASVIANPPWGTRVPRDVVTRFKDRVEPEIAEELRGELSSYALFLVEALASHASAMVFVTPLHWMIRRSLADTRRRFAADQRLRDVHLLRKGAFLAARDMIPVVTTWSARADASPIAVRHTGFRAPLPLPHPLPVQRSGSISHAAWAKLPFATFPLLRWGDRSRAGDRLMTMSSAFAVPTGRPHTAWFHLGDGVYKTKLRDRLAGTPCAGLPFLTRGAQLRRYYLRNASEWLPESAVGEVVSTTDRRRFGGPKLVLHAMKKANAPWRLSAALHDPETMGGPLGLTNNFVVLTSAAFDGDLRYPLALLNSRAMNRLYTDHFAGVNLEAYTRGALPFPWPLAPTTYEALLDAAERMITSEGRDRDADETIERLVEHILGLPSGWARLTADGRAIE